jgi:peptide/nickel transport system substrate-binding protein
MQNAASRYHGQDTLVVAMAKAPEPIALNPLLLEGQNAYTYSELLYSYLTRYDAGGHVTGDLAREVPTPENGGVSADGKTITFHLRHGVRWEDGVPVTARDVVFSYRAVMNPANNVPERYGFDLVDSIAAPDPYTVVIRLKRAFSPIIGFFFGGDSNYPILPAHLLAALPSINTATFNARPVGSGPYRMERWDRGDRITLEANASYYGGRPGIERVVLPFVHDSGTIVNELYSGELDAAFLLDASRIAQLRAIPNHRVVVTPVPYFYSLEFNLDDPVVADHAVREAIALGIDRRMLARKITLGVYDAETAMRGLFTWAFDPRADRLTFDPARAQQLLARDGWLPGPGGIRTKNGKPLRLQLSLPAGSDITTRYATAIAEEERAIGVDVTLRQYDREQFIATDGPIIQGHYQIALYDVQATYDPDASWYLACDQRAPHGFNLARYCNRTVDALLHRAAATFDRAERIAAYHRVQQLIASDLPYDFLCQISEVDVIPSSLRGYADPILSPFNSVSSWRLQ